LEIENGFLSLPYHVIKNVMGKLETNSVELLLNASLIFRDIMNAERVERLISNFIRDWQLMIAEWRLPFRMGKVKRRGFYDNERQNNNMPDLIPSDKEMLSNMQILRSIHFKKWKVNDLNKIRDIPSSNIYILPSKSNFRDEIIDIIQNC